jgi:hypothetical protein
MANESRPYRGHSTELAWPAVDLDGEEHVFQYLESLHSVSAPWVGQGDPAHVDDRALTRRDQIFLDVLMTLAFGRDVAVPQSYAFDSGGLLEVATMVLKARDSAHANADHPFRPICLNSIPSIKQWRICYQESDAQIDPFTARCCPSLTRQLKKASRSHGLSTNYCKANSSTTNLRKHYAQYNGS